MLTDKIYVPFLQHLGLIENVHYIASTPQDLEKTLQYWLESSRSDDLKKISQNGRDLVSSCHRNDRRKDFFDRTIQQEFFAKDLHD